MRSTLVRNVLVGSVLELQQIRGGKRQIDTVATAFQLGLHGGEQSSKTIRYRYYGIFSVSLIACQQKEIWRLLRHHFNSFVSANLLIAMSVSDCLEKPQ